MGFINEDLGIIGAVYTGGFENLGFQIRASRVLKKRLEARGKRISYVVASSTGIFAGSATACGLEELEKVDTFVTENLKSTDIVVKEFLSVKSYNGPSFLFNDDSLVTTLKQRVNFKKLFSEEAIHFEATGTVFSNYRGGETLYFSNKDPFLKEYASNIEKATNVFIAATKNFEEVKKKFKDKARKEYKEAEIEYKEAKIVYDRLKSFEDYYASAMAASVSQTPWFKPKNISIFNPDGTIKETVLVGDGAYTDPVPIERAIDMGCDTIFVLDVHGHKRWIYDDATTWPRFIALAQHTSIDRIYKMTIGWTQRVNGYLEVYQEFYKERLDQIEIDKQKILETIGDVGDEVKKKIIAFYEEKKDTAKEKVENKIQRLFGSIRPVKIHTIYTDSHVAFNFDKFSNQEIIASAMLGEWETDRYLKSIGL
ncbi:MAG: hypothetical protein HYW78_02245 [Parcubacteria group bacterium]|nr:hypothetical protein [Parcubacteria group bacterium]